LSCRGSKLGLGHRLQESRVCALESGLDVGGVDVQPTEHTTRFLSEDVPTGGVGEALTREGQDSLPQLDGKAGEAPGLRAGRSLPPRDPPGDSFPFDVRHSFAMERGGVDRVECAGQAVLADQGQDGAPFPFHREVR
jgi:hypothetical protein